VLLYGPFASCHDLAFVVERIRLVSLFLPRPDDNPTRIPKIEHLTINACTQNHRNSSEIRGAECSNEGHSLTITLRTRRRFFEVSWFVANTIPPRSFRARGRRGGGDVVESWTVWPNHFHRPTIMVPSGSSGTIEQVPSPARRHSYAVAYSQCLRRCHNG
jgi:hypothetical protein